MQCQRRVKFICVQLRFKPEAKMSAVENLTLSKPPCNPPSSDALSVCVCVHVCLFLKLQNKRLLMPIGYLCDFHEKKRQFGRGVREGWRMQSEERRKKQARMEKIREKSHEEQKQRKGQRLWREMSSHSTEKKRSYDDVLLRKKMDVGKT